MKRRRGRRCPGGMPWAVGVAAAVVSLALSAGAGWNPAAKTYDTSGYVKLTRSSGSYDDTTVFDQPDAWAWPGGKTPRAMDPNADYCYDGASRISRTPNTRDYRLAARTLAVNGQFHQSSAHCFTMTNMHLLNGGQFLLWGSHSRFTNCVFTVYSDAAHAFRANIAVDAGNPSEGIRFLNTAIRGEEWAVMKLHGDRATQRYAPFWWTGDGSAYRGKMIVEMPNSAVGGYAALNLGAVDFAGTLVLTNAARLAPYGPGTVKVARLVAEEGAALQFGKGAGAVAVASSLTLRPPLRIMLDEGARPSRPTAERTLLTAPKGSFAVGDLRLTDLSGAAVADWIAPKVEEDGGTARLTVALKPLVTLVTVRSGAVGSPFLAANRDCWSDGELPHAGGDYLIDKSSFFYLPDDKATLRFGGDMLTLTGGASMNSGGNGSTAFLCGDLRVSSGSVRTWGHDFALSGGTVALTGPLTLVHYGGRTSVFSVDSELTGGGKLTCDSYVSASESGSCGQFALTALNTNFLGKIRVTIPSGAKDYGEVPSAARMTTLHVADPRNLGGPLAAFTPDALQLEQMSVLKPAGTMTLDTPNRGLRVLGMGRIDVPERATLTLANPVTYAGLLRKEGEGALALAAAPRLDGGAGSNRLEVAAGAVKPLCANCLDGVALSVGDGGRLVFDIDPKAEGLREYGVRLAEPPQTTVTVGFDTGTHPDAPPADGWEVALFTLPTARAAATLPLLHAEKAYPRFAVDLAARDNGDGTTTLLAVHRRRVCAVAAATYRTDLPFFSGAGEVEVPRGVHLDFVGFASNEFAGVDFVIARGASLRVPPDFADWTYSPTQDGYGLTVTVRGGELIARVSKVERAVASRNGNLLFDGLGRSVPFQPVFITTTSQLNYGKGSAYPDEGNAYSFSNLTAAAGVWLDGRLTVTQRDYRTATATWTFVPTGDIAESHGICVWLNLPGGAFGGGAATFNGTRAVALPAAYKTTSLANLSDARTLTVTDAQGRERFTLAFPEATHVMVRDMRQGSSTGSFEFRIYHPQQNDLRAGREYRIAFDLSSPAVVDGTRPLSVTIARDAAWVPVTAHERVLPGSALDFTDVCGTGKPAGKHGRVVRVGDHFEFAGLPGREQRFFGLTMGASEYVFAAEARDAGLADIARRGYNATRVHDYESAIVNPADATQTSFDPAKMRLFDGYVAASVSNGLYVILELYGNHRTPSWRSIGEDRDGNVTRDEAKMLLLCHEGMISNQLAYIRAYLTHVNAFTGRSFIDEPAVVGADFVNEWPLGYSRVQDVGAKAGDDLASAWRKWVAAKRRADPAKYGGVSDAIPGISNSTLAGRMYVQFLREKHEGVVRRLRKFLREELGFAAPLSDFNGAGWAAFAPSRDENNDYIDDHFYEDHPSFLEEQFKLPSGFRHDNQNPILTAKSSGAFRKGVPSAFAPTLRGKPFVVTEFNYVCPSRFRFAGGLLMGAVAGLQAADGLWQHSYSFNRADKKSGWFDYVSDPLMPAWSRAALTLFARRDMRPLRREYVTRIDPAAARSDAEGTMNGSALDASPVQWAAWYAKTGVVVADEAPAGVPTSGDWAATMAKKEAGVMSDLGLARDADGRLPPAGEGQVRLDDVAGSLMVTTERTAGGFAERGAIDGGALRADVGEVPTAIWVSSLDGKAIASSKRLLLTHLTDVQDEGLTYLDETLTTQLSWGNLPHLMRRGVVRVELAVGPGNWFVYALAGNGARRFSVPSSQEGGTLRFTADIGADPDEATYLYELVRHVGFAVRLR